jgi:hypothetical protein
MDIQSFQNNRPPSFYLIEELLRPVIDQGSNIVIKYDIQEQSPGKTFKFKIVIHSVNSCKSPTDFRKKLTALVDSAMHKFYDSLLHIHLSLRPLHTEYIRSKLQALTLLVLEEQSVFHDETGRFSRHQQFKTFTNCVLVGLKKGDCEMFGQWIRFKAAKFAETWLDVISSAIDQVDLIHNILSKSPGDDSLPIQQEISRTNNYKLKLNLSVSDIGYLSKLLRISGIIDIQPRHIADLINWLVANIQSKKCDIIQFSSMRKNHFSADPSSVDFWAEIIKEWGSIILQDQDQFL